MEMEVKERQEQVNESKAVMNSAVTVGTMRKREKECEKEKISDFCPNNKTSC